MSSSSVIASRLEGLAARLGTRRARAVTVLAAALLAATSVSPYRVIDDYVLALIARGAGGPLGLHRSPLDLFTFTTGDPENNHELMDAGLMLPWWTDPSLKISFFRPLASLTHSLDERFLGGSAVLMHLHSLVWFAAGLAVAGALYRRLESSAPLAGLSFALYAMDDAHGLTLTWIANRNALIALFFGVLTLVLHDAWRQGKSRLAAVLAPLALILGLLGGEAAVGTLAYLASYAAFRDGASRGVRIASLAPYAGVVALWRVAWSSGGFGAHGSGAYIDPLRDPVAFLLLLPEKLLVLTLGLFSAIPSDLAFLGPPRTLPPFLALAAVTVGLVGWTLAPVLRTDPTTRFWAAGMALSLVPLAATFPSDRMLGFAGLGAMPLLARLFQGFLRAVAAGERVPAGRAVMTLALAGTHAVFAPVSLVLRSGTTAVYGLAEERAESGIPTDPSIAEKTVVVLAAPTVLFVNYVQAERLARGVPRPRHLYVLSSASSPIEVTRSRPDSLTVVPEHGFLYTPLDRHYRGTLPFRVGDSVALATMTARVETATDDGRPSAVRFDFTEPLDHYVFVAFEKGRFTPVQLPALGESRALKEEDFQKILMKTALGSRFD